MKFKLFENNEAEVMKAITSFRARFGDLQLFHGSPKNFPSGTKLDFRFRSTPKDTPTVVNALVNDALLKEYGLPIRNLLYTTQEYEIADGYGRIYVVIPTGNYRMFCVPDVQDFTAHFDMRTFQDRTADRVIDNLAEDYDDETMSRIKDILSDNWRFFLVVEQAKSVEELRSIPRNYSVKNPKDRELFGDFALAYIEELQEMVDHHILDDYDVEEIISESDVPYNEIEIMCYFPDGFYLIHTDDFDDYLQ